MKYFKNKNHKIAVGGLLEPFQSPVSPSDELMQKLENSKIMNSGNSIGCKSSKHFGT